MASVIGLMESARAYLPSLKPFRRRGRDEVRHVALPEHREEAVAGVISAHVIPRLLAAHRHDDAVVVAVGGDHVNAEEAVAFAPLALELEADALLDHVEVFLHRGVSVDTVFVELLAPAARQLGILWEDDRCDFIDVTMGLWRLQEIVRELSSRSPDRFGAERAARTALFSVFPGEQHSFGTVVIDDVFRRGGWASHYLSECTTPDLLDRVARQSFDLVGLTVSHDDHIGHLPSLVLALRSVSRNPNLCIMLGGRVLTANPELLAKTGADGTAPDAVVALEVAGRLVAALAPREVISA